MTLLHVDLGPGSVLGIPGIHQMYLQTILFQPGIQYTPVDCIATLRTPLAISHLAIPRRSTVKHPKRSTRSGPRSGLTVTQWLAATHLNPGGARVDGIECFPRP
ncbi:MAG TPA: hypothetical protein VKV15_07040 [Bryobacteraceae bacterium]|nr:hypothetical protein [Bryobacteraceae bacterium]